MGHYPQQDFFYGCSVYGLEYDESKFESLSEAIEHFCNENGFEFVEAGSAVDGGTGEFVIGFKLPMYNSSLVNDAYFGGYHVDQFLPLEFIAELMKLKEKMTHDHYDKIMEFTKSEYDPVFLTVSSSG